MAVIRRVVGKAGEIGREEALRRVAEALNYGRVGANIRHTLRHALRNAVLRKVLTNDGGVLSLYARSIEGYSRDELKGALLKAVGRTWWVREEAIQAAARYLGFRRAKARIRSAFKSAINGALRQELLEKDGNWIRRARNS